MINPGIFDQFSNVVAGYSNTDTHASDLSDKNFWYPEDIISARKDAVSALNLKKEPNYLWQIHSDIVHHVDDEFAVGVDGDAMRTSSIDTPLVVHVADCVPLLIYGKNAKSMIAVVHSGWKGTVKNIVGKTLDVFLTRGIGPENIFISIGPAISQKCYEFGDEVYEYFDKKYVASSDGKLYLDVTAAVVDQILSYQIPSMNIEKMTICTYESDKHYSYRKEKGSKRRIFGVICMKDNL